MIIVLKPNSTTKEIDHILERIQELGFKPHLSRGELRTIVGVIGDENKLHAEPLEAIAGVEQVLPIMKPFKLASREFNKTDTVVVSLTELIRRHRIDELKGLAGRVDLGIDLGRSRRRPDEVPARRAKLARRKRRPGLSQAKP